MRRRSSGPLSGSLSYSNAAHPRYYTLDAHFDWVYSHRLYLLRVDIARNRRRGVPGKRKMRWAKVRCVVPRPMQHIENTAIVHSFRNVRSNPTFEVLFTIVFIERKFDRDISKSLTLRTLFRKDGI